MLGFPKSRLTAKKPRDHKTYSAPARITDRINISQICLSGSSAQEFFPFIKHAISTVDHAFPNADHVIYNTETLRQFIPDNYDGNVLELTPNHEQKNKAFVLPDGTILAWGKPSEGGDLEELGARGVNNYNELWRAGNVYN